MSDYYVLWGNSPVYASNNQSKLDKVISYLKTLPQRKEVELKEVPAHHEEYRLRIVEGVSEGIWGLFKAG